MIFTALKKTSRKFKYKGYFTSLSFSILKNLRTKKDKGMWPYTLRSKSRSCFADLFRSLFYD